MLRLARKLAAIGLAFGLIVGLAWADDEITRRSGGTPLRGTITAETANEVTIQIKTTGKTETVPVNELAKVKYDGKVGLDIVQAEILENGGERQKAVDAYGRVAKDAADKEIVARAASFGRVRTIFKQALRDPGRIDEAIKEIEDYRAKFPNTRFHYALHEMLGQLYLSKGKGEQASAAFAALAKAPWPEIKLKAEVYEGRVQVAAGHYDEAYVIFDVVSKSAGDSTEEKLRQQEAQLGKAECLVKQKKYPEAGRFLREVIDAASADESALQAAAHNLHGDVLRETGKPQEAIFAYLYVDLFYSGEREEHAKALCYIALLWDQRGRTDRAADARSKLKDHYPSSPWVKVAEPEAKTEDAAKPASETKTEGESKTESGTKEKGDR